MKVDLSFPSFTGKYTSTNSSESHGNRENKIASKRTCIMDRYDFRYSKTYQGLSSLSKIPVEKKQKALIMYIILGKPWLYLENIGNNRSNISTQK